MLETERFIVLILREKFDYTKWRENLFDGLSGNEISNSPYASDLTPRPPSLRGQGE